MAEVYSKERADYRDHNNSNENFNSIRVMIWVVEEIDKIVLDFSVIDGDQANDDCERNNADDN